MSYNIKVNIINSISPGALWLFFCLFFGHVHGDFYCFGKSNSQIMYKLTVA